MRLSEILDENYISEYAAAEVELQDISSSVEETVEGTLFVHIKSIKNDNFKIISNALERKPCAIICDEDAELPETDIKVFRVKSTRRTLPFMYSRFYGIDYSKMKFTAITGTNGKSTTSEILRKILEYSGARVGYIGTGKIEIGERRLTESTYSMTTPDPRLLYSSIKEMEKEGCTHVVMEVSSHALYFEKTAAIPFELGVYTNISPEHLDFHKTLEEYKRVKLLLSRQAKKCIFNLDDNHLMQLYGDCSSEKLGYGIIRPSDIYAHDIELDGIFGSEYIYRDGKRIFKVKLHLGGAHNIYNSMAAVAAAIELKIPACIIKNAINAITKIEGRLELIRDKINVVIDYAHTEEAFRCVLKMLKSTLICRQKLIVVFGCGGERYKEKRAVMGALAELYSDFTVVTADNSRGEPLSVIIEDILSGFRDTEKRTVITDRAAAIRHAIMLADDGDTVAVIGKGHERYNVDASGYHSFDERSIIYEALKLRAEKRAYENRA